MTEIVDEMTGRPPRGGRGLKSDEALIDGKYYCRPPRGGRGLKYRTYSHNSRQTYRRPPRRGRGLKYHQTALFQGYGSSSRPPRGGRGLKSPTQQWQGCLFSRPPRGGRGLKCCAMLHSNMSLKQVAPLAGGVD